jgi:exopolysaccharide biosynthesis polyprenyl glycosylphosphotransferase
VTEILDISAGQQRRSKLAYRRRALGVDGVALAVAAAIVAVISPTGSPTGSVPAEPLGWVVASSLAVLVCFALRDGYVAPLRLDGLDALRLVVMGSALAAVLTMTARVLVANDAYVAAETVRHWLAAVPLLAVGRLGLLWTEARARRRGIAGEPTLVVGAGKVGRLTARRLLREPELGLLPVAFLDDDPLPLEDELTGDLPVIRSDELEPTIQKADIRQVVVTYSRASAEELLELCRKAMATGATVSVVPRLFELEGERVATEHLGGLPLVEMRPSDPNGWRYTAKYAFDRVAGAALLLLALPIILVAGAAVLISMGRPVFFRQRRVGLDGHEFDMIKLRTLTHASAVGSEADADWIAEQLGESVSDHVPLEHRLTRVGSFLRRYSVDEVPQLWNVVRGDMSLIGPRPERATAARRFEGDVHRYGDRHRVKSGLTGWAQVNGLRGRTPLADRVEWDNHYIENWSPWLDFKILVRTLGRVLRGQPEA